MNRSDIESIRSLVPRIAPLITVVSASGGVGKSTIALMLAHLAAHQPMSTALLEGDLQFGDMGFWLGLDVNLPNLSQGEDCVPITISNHLDLYKAPVLPELAELVSESIARMVPSIRKEYELVIADTGQFWTGLTADLVCASDLVLLVMDQRDSSVYGAIKALELCRRLGVPSARITCISNRCSGKSKSGTEKLRTSLGVDEVFFFSDGKAPVETLMSSGRTEELVEGGGAPVPEMQNALATLLPRIGIEYAERPRMKTRRLFS